MEETTLLIFQLVVLIFSVMIHEVSHGYVAEHLGDPTARLAGRLTVNPLKHIVPIPPLDGSKVLFAILPKNEKSLQFFAQLERYGMFLVFLFIFFGFGIVTPIIDLLFT